jgi:hypothetical protein
MARTAVIAGTASATANAVNSRAQGKAAAQQQEAAQQQAAAEQQATAPAAGGMDDMTAQLTQLKALLDQGILTQEEFDAKKKQLLGI